MKKLLRIRCYYCDEKLIVDFYEMRKFDSANKLLQRNGWIFGVVREGGDVLFDPLCHNCGRGVIKTMLEDGQGKIDPDAEKSLRRIYPDLFDGEKN